MNITINWKGGNSESRLIGGESCGDAFRTICRTWSKQDISALDMIKCEWNGQINIYPAEIEAGALYHGDNKVDLYKMTEYHAEKTKRKAMLIDRVNKKRALAGIPKHRITA